MNTQRFSRAIMYFVSLSLVMVSCTSTVTTIAPTNTIMPSTTPFPTFTPTLTSTPTFTPTATPTIALPVSAMTSAPFSNTQINAQNVENLQEIANYSGDWQFYLRQHNFQFIDMNTLAFDSVLSYSNGSTKPCNIQINNGLSMCTDQNIMLGTDGQYYSYSVVNGNLEIRSNVDLNKFYSIELTGSQRVTLEGIDTVNKIIFYEAGILGDHKTIIQDIENQHIIAQWQGSTSISSIKFDKNKKLAAICRKKGNAWSWNFVDSLLLLDLTQKTIIYDVPFDCWGDYSFSNDGKKLVTEHFSINPNNSSVTISVTDISPPINAINLKWRILVGTDMRLLFPQMTK